MLTYRAMYKFVDGGVHAEVIDFPGAISTGRDLDDARAMVGSALCDMAESLLLDGKPLPIPDPHATDPEADLEEPIHLLLSASPHVATVSKVAS